MSSAPTTLLELRSFLAEQYGVEGKNFGIRGTCTAKRPWGYHLGEADIFGDCGMKSRDYSLQYKRDRNGLSNASAAIDIRLPSAKLRPLVAYLVQQGSNNYAFGGKVLLVEVIGPNSEGVAKRWARATNWRPVDATDNHEWHTHVSFYRDTEFIDKRPLFATHLGVNLSDLDDDDEPDSPLAPEGGEKPPPEVTEQPDLDEAAQLAEAEDALRDVLGIVNSYFEPK